MTANRKRNMDANELEFGLRVAGLMLSGLVVANFVAARRWSYAENLAGADLIVRQIFHVHCAYIVAIIAALAVLCLGWPQLLLDGAMGRVISGFFGLFWASRVVVQLTYYDRELRRRDRCWDVFFLGVFLVLSAVFTLTAWLQ
jgi:succinate-acetate transporter protein